MSVFDETKWHDCTFPPLLPKRTDGKWWWGLFSTKIPQRRRVMAGDKLRWEYRLRDETPEEWENRAVY